MLKAIYGYHRFDAILREDLHLAYKVLKIDSTKENDLTDAQKMAVYAVLTLHNAAVNRDNYLSEEIELLKTIKFKQQKAYQIRNNPNAGLTMHIIPEHENIDGRPWRHEAVKDSKLEKALQDFDFGNITSYVPEPMIIDDSDPTTVFIPKEELKDLKDEERGSKTSYFDRLAKLSESKERRALNPDAESAFYFLRQDMPNFTPVIDDVWARLQAAKESGTPFRMHNILINGAPGIGKTLFIKRLAKALDVESHFISMSGSVDAMKIRGLSRGWGNAKPGELALRLAAGKTFNPLFCIDEIDKAVTDRRDGLTDVPAAMLGLLERETNGIFEDEYIARPMDLSELMFIFTTNDYTLLPDHFLSRMQVYDIKEQTPEQKQSIVKNILNQINTDEFNEYLTAYEDEAVDALVGLDNFREVRRIAATAMAYTVAKKERTLTTEHMRLPQNEPKRTIGFV